ncbi:MAG: molybdopterin cofactor-binding domain-containing protein [Granulosicoccaceae bacterium]
MKIDRLLQSNSTTRRGFLKLVAVSGAGLAVGVAPAQADSETAEVSQHMANAFVRIGSDDTVTVVIKHLEMGQGTYTGLATLVAEELDADWSKVRAESAPADAAKYKNLFFGMQGTGGSTAIANSYMQMRQAGAAARAMLVAAAAQQWGVPAEEISIADSVLSHASGKSARFGELAEAAATQAIPEADTLLLKDPADFKLIGKTIARKDTGKTDGSAVYTQDIQLPGMLTAVLAHAPRFGATVKSVDDASALAIVGVERVVVMPNFVAVLAKDFWGAKKGRDALKVEWDQSKASRATSSELESKYIELAATPGLVARSEGDVTAVLDSAADRLEAVYAFPYLAHATMEPLNCVVHVHEGGVDLWNGDQMQTIDQGAVAQVCGVAPERVSVHTLYAGGSFGRRANPHADYVVEAALIAKAVTGTPIKMVWTREDDMRGGYYRPQYVHRIEAALDDENKIQAWRQRLVGDSIMTGTAFEQFTVKDGIDSTSVEGASTLPYALPGLQVESHNTSAGVPVLWWRSVGHTHTAFSTEAFVDELAQAAGEDPVSWREQRLQKHPRHLGVLKLVAEKAGWGRPMPEGKARGIAVHESFNSFVAQVAEVSVDNGQIRVERVVCAVDCGVAVNPDVIRAQMEGGIGYGLSAALGSEITLVDGEVQQSNFHDYFSLRMDQMPEIEVHIVPSAEPPTGVGEPATPVIAPAVANAVAALTGQRLRRLPLRLA